MARIYNPIPKGVVSVPKLGLAGAHATSATGILSTSAVYRINRSGNYNGLSPGRYVLLNIATNGYASNNSLVLVPCTVQGASPKTFMIEEQPDEYSCIIESTSVNPSLPGMKPNSRANQALHIVVGPF